MVPRTLDSAPTVRDRLISAADTVIARSGLEAASPVAIAEEAGVSRATAFRRLGKRSDILHAVAVHRVRRLIPGCLAEMCRSESPMQQIEHGFHYLTVNLPLDPVVAEVLHFSAVNVLDEDAHLLATEIFGGALQAGRSADQIRTDVPAVIVLGWLLEQLYLALRQPDQTRNATQTRITTFIWPAIAIGR